jgi:hypothetical protein
MSGDINQATSLVGECTDSYIVTEHEDGRVIITIDIPERFSNLWLMKLSELKATNLEIQTLAPFKRSPQ